MVIASNEILTTKGDSLTFEVSFMQDGTCVMIVKGCRIVKGYLWGPAYRTKAGGLRPQVQFFNPIRADIMEAVRKTGWSKRYPAVEFPKEAQGE